MSSIALLKQSSQNVTALEHVGHSCDEVFKRSYNQQSFLFAHDLDREPLLSLPSLAALAERLEPLGSYYWSEDAAAIGDGWGAGRSRHRGLADAVASIAGSSSLIMLRNVIHDPLFGSLFSGVVRQIVALCGAPLRDDMLEARATILIASPGRLTPYHADLDTNFLMQIAGDKRFGVLGQTDRDVVPETEIEHLLAGEPSAMRHKPEFHDRATVHAFKPGQGIHVPCFAPHWAENGSEVSIALSLNFDLKSVARRARICRVNRHLRRLGVVPSAPGTRLRRDALKSAIGGLSREAVARRFGRHIA